MLGVQSQSPLQHSPRADPAPNWSSQGLTFVSLDDGMFFTDGRYLPTLIPRRSFKLDGGCFSEITLIVFDNENFSRYCTLWSSFRPTN